MTEKSLTNVRYILSGRRSEIVEEIDRWRRDQPPAECQSHPDCPICLLETELDLLDRYTSCLERQLWHLHQKGVSNHDV